MLEPYPPSRRIRIMQEGQKLPESTRRDIRNNLAVLVKERMGGGDERMRGYLGK